MSVFFFFKCCHFKSFEHTRTPLDSLSKWNAKQQFRSKEKPHSLATLSLSHTLTIARMSMILSFTFLVVLLANKPSIICLHTQLTPGNFQPSTLSISFRSFVCNVFICIHHHSITSIGWFGNFCNARIRCSRLLAASFQNSCCFLFRINSRESRIPMEHLNIDFDIVLFLGMKSPPYTHIILSFLLLKMMMKSLRVLMFIGCFFFLFAEWLLCVKTITWIWTHTKLLKHDIVSYARFWFSFTILRLVVELHATSCWVIFFVGCCCCCCSALVLSWQIISCTNSIFC